MPVLEGRAGCPPHKRTYSLWNRPESLFLKGGQDAHSTKELTLCGTGRKACS
ncbi:hypothetical protein [Microcoleus vaginatus]|uniref:hypothetical protein n=1 Tax=Microcoleus vaginatus TaxID=119532 RepID=UPI001F61B344